MKAGQDGMHLRVIFDLIYQIGKRAQRVKIQFSVLIEMLYMTLYQIPSQ